MNPNRKLGREPEAVPVFYPEPVLSGSGFSDKNRNQSNQQLRHGFDLNQHLAISFIIGWGAVAECSTALLLREKINENQKILGSPTGLGKLEKSQFRYLTNG